MNSYLKPSIWTKISGKIAKAVAENIKAKDIKEFPDKVTFKVFGHECEIKFIVKGGKE